MEEKGILDYNRSSDYPFYDGNTVESRQITVDIDKLAALNTNGLQLLAYINYSGGLNGRYVVINQEEAAKYIKGSETSAALSFVRRGILNLLQNNIIVRGIAQNYYWLNKNIIWKENPSSQSTTVK